MCDLVDELLHDDSRRRRSRRGAAGPRTRVTDEPWRRWSSRSSALVDLRMAGHELTPLLDESRPLRRRAHDIGAIAQLRCMCKSMYAVALYAHACIVPAHDLHHSHHRQRPLRPARLGAAAGRLRRRLPRRARHLDGRRRAALDRRRPHMSTTVLQWIVSGYVLGYGGFLLLGGRAADLLGRRRVFLAALAALRGRVAARRARRRRHAAHRHALPEGRRRGVHRARRALDRHDDLRRGPRAQPRARRSTPPRARPASPAASSSAAC